MGTVECASLPRAGISNLVRRDQQSLTLQAFFFYEPFRQRTPDISDLFKNYKDLSVSPLTESRPPSMLRNAYLK